MEYHARKRRREEEEEEEEEAEPAYTAGHCKVDMEELSTANYVPLAFYACGYKGM
jgi:hypothetical protein